MVGEIGEFPFGIDDHHRQVVLRFFDQVAQRRALAGAGRTLNEAPSRKETVKIEVEGSVRRVPERDRWPVRHSWRCRKWCLRRTRRSGLD